MNNFTPLIKRPSLIKIILTTAFTLLAKKKKLPDNTPLREINGYVFLHGIAKNNPFKTFALGIYKKNGKKFFIKTWQGAVKDLGYYAIVNEYYAISILQSKLSGVIAVPKIEAVHRDKKSFSIIYEYVEGEDPLRMSYEEQKKLLLSIISSLQSIRLTPAEEKYFPKRNLLFFMLVFSIIAYQAYRNNSSMRKLILASFLKVWKHVPSLLNNNLVIAHRDLAPDNIMKNGSVTYLLDFEQIALTVSSYDLSYISVVSEFTPLRKGLQREFMKNANMFMRIYILFTLAAYPQNTAEYKAIYKKTLEELYVQL